MANNDYSSTLLTKDIETNKALLDLLAKINKTQKTIESTIQESNFPRWTDARGIASVRTAGANIPGFNAYRGNMRAFEFDTLLRELWCRIQIPHGYQEGTIPRLHVHFFHASAVDNGAVVWQAEVTAYNGSNGIKPLPQIIKAQPVQILGSQQYTEIIADFGELSMFDWRDKKISCMIEYRLFRDPAEPNDTSTASAWLDETDAHFLLDSEGSREEFTK